MLSAFTFAIELWSIQPHQTWMRIEVTVKYSCLVGLLKMPNEDVKECSRWEIDIDEITTP